MPKWEYCMLKPSAPGWTLVTLEGLVREDFPQDATGFMTVAPTIARLGLEGWELVAVDDGTWYFKRPLAQST